MARPCRIKFRCWRLAAEAGVELEEGQELALAKTPAFPPPKTLEPAATTGAAERACSNLRLVISMRPPDVKALLSSESAKCGPEIWVGSLWILLFHRQLRWLHYR